MKKQKDLGLDVDFEMNDNRELAQKGKKRYLIVETRNSSSPFFSL